MSKRDILNEVIRVGSVMGTVREDVGKALVASEAHPRLAETIMKLHDTQFKLDKAMQELQRGQLEQAQLLDRIVNTLGIAMAGVETMANKVGVPMTSVFGPEGGDDD